MACTSKDLQKLTAAAKDEIGESNANLVESVQTVKGILVEKYPTLKFPPDIDEIVERSLRIRKFDCAQAATQVHLFFEYLFECRSMHKEMYFLPSTQKEYFFDSLGYAVLKNRDSKGRMLLLLRMGKFHKLILYWFYNLNFKECKLLERISSTYEVDKDLATFAMVLDEMTRYSVDTQRLGVVIVCDMTGFNFAHAKQYTFSRMKAAVKPMQGSVPVNIERIHLVRNPYIFTVMFALMKLFMDEKLKNRVRMKL